jgi:RNA polymerase II elongation factor ELL
LQSAGDLKLRSIISHQLGLKVHERKPSLGTDAALAALQQNLASVQQQKQALHTNITSSVLATPQNRYDAAKEQKRAGKRGLTGPQAADLASDARLRSLQVNVPADEAAARTKAMRTSLIHLLAVRPLARNDIQATTRIPSSDLDEALTRIGKEAEGKWELTPRAYKDLDAWKFAYRSQTERQSAIDNAIKAYDRLRLGKEDNLWQMLLPIERRGKGELLSRLQLGNKISTPRHAGSPLNPWDGSNEEKNIGSVASPAAGSVSTPKILAAKGDAVSKRLLSKDPKKARAVEATKDKKRKERDVASAASDRESANPARKRQVTQNNNPKIKSAAVVHSSSDEMDEESTVKVSHKRSDPAPKSASQGKLPGITRKTAANVTTKPVTRLPPATQVNSPVTSDKSAPGKASSASNQKPSGAAASTGTTRSLSMAKKPSAIGKNTSSALAAPAGQRAQYSPQLNGNRTHVPSPLGAAARSRGTSDGSDKPLAETQRYRAGADTPGENVIVNRPRKEPQSAKADVERHKITGDAKVLPRKPMPSASLPPKPPQQVNGAGRAITTAQKRKPVDSPTEDLEDTAKPKQRRFALTANGNASKRGLDSNGETVSSSDSASSNADEITFSQALDMAERFNEMYPRYSRLYDEYEVRSSRGEVVTKRERESLLRLHDQLEQWKQDIVAAAERENGSVHERRIS